LASTARPQLENIDVVILAGGLGTRLRNVVGDRPKVLAPVAGRPFLEYLLRWLIKYKARRIFISVGYLFRRHSSMKLIKRGSMRGLMAANS
jgi:NDP-sugar pyrophosphorylase family protein